MKNSLDNKSLRTVYYVLIICFALLLIWQLYRWSQGNDNLRGIGSPLGFIFLFTSMLIGKRNVALSYVLLAAAMVCVFASLILAII